VFKSLGPKARLYPFLLDSIGLAVCAGLIEAIDHTTGIHPTGGTSGAKRLCAVGKSIW
jgi:hypothetical protein